MHLQIATTLLLLLSPTTAAPTAKDFLRPVAGAEGDLGLKTGRIGVDKVDLSRLRVDPVSVDARGRTSSSTRRDTGPDPAVDAVHLPSPYVEPPEVEAREEEDDVLPKWRKKFDVEANWLDG
ncbi:hypothetical protein CPLU01_10127 [Colletotrichum plurivorum]|uniref:Uncharacterized protein n=1 Tax=Colletotrichum plurivorum TaxID=2175906 RepID=A0A8H6K6A9_9PEZI|nr:hypothetical protein CPLU01_10127 [Colletotrichum plurivorum]